jgi:hypothetical protein
VVHRDGTVASQINKINNTNNLRTGISERSLDLLDRTVFVRDRKESACSGGFASRTPSMFAAWPVVGRVRRSVKTIAHCAWS